MKTSVTYRFEGLGLCHIYCLCLKQGKMSISFIWNDGSGYEYNVYR